MVLEVSAGVWGYTLDRFGFDCSIELIMGLTYRVLAFFLLIGLNRDKQR
jgi:hypothetical protein